LSASAGAIASVASRTSATVTSGPASGRESRNAISPSTRGAMKRPAGSAAPLGLTMSSVR
jgi:hypothetical protein